MPIFIPKTANPFNSETTAQSSTTAPKESKLKLPQVRVLKALMPRRPDFPPSEWPLVTRQQLIVRAGFTKLSGSITRALNGIRPGNKTSGEPHPGLIDKGFVEIIDLDIDGVTEANYRITRAGIVAYQEYVAAYGDNLPQIKDPSITTNQRYRKSENE